jgi:hypothetical protein
MFMGLVFFGAGVWFVMMRGDTNDGVIFSFVILLGIVLMCVPLIKAIRESRSTANGILADSVVHDVFFEPASVSRATLDAMTNGFATGKRVVMHPLGDFENDFESDEEWASSVTKGSIIQVLVAPTERKVLMNTGIKESIEPAV